MSGFQTPITIYQAMQNIDNKEYLLPAFQREFVWRADQIERLFDSLMQGYPISSMLFWKVKDKTRTDFTFFNFLNSYVERHKTHNEVKSNIGKDFYAILDGQQRLTALYLGLYGTYAYHEYRHSWDNNPNSFPERKLYLCITKVNSDTENDKKYLFSFLKTADTNNSDLYKDNSGELWFRVGRILSLHLEDYDLDDFCTDKTISRESKKILKYLDNSIFVAPTINFYEEDAQEADKAVSIFTRINSGGTYLSFSDIMFALLISNWVRDARTEINQLVDRVNDKGFSISKDFVLKSFLFLYHKSVKSSLNSFSADFCKLLEKNWIEIRDAIDSLFDLLRSFGLNSFTLTSNNATLPILYYLFHQKIYENFTNAKKFEGDRNRIKKWLLSVLIRHGFSGQSDSALTSARKAFTDDVDKQFIKSLSEFPSENLSEQLKRHLDALDDESLSELLNIQKDNKNSFIILATLYPNLDYKNNNFHKDHLHPRDAYEDLPNEIKEKYPFWQYDSIVNLQMLDANENESKGNMPLSDWVAKELKKANYRTQFFESHIIPDVNLDKDNFAEFYEQRKKMLIDKLKELL